MIMIMIMNMNMNVNININMNMTMTKELIRNFFAQTSNFFVSAFQYVLLNSKITLVGCHTYREVGLCNSKGNFNFW